MMAVSFILGRAGSGKTHLCLEEIGNELRKGVEGPPLIFLVPEQATFQMEQELVRTPGLECITRAQVLSFRRLAWRVFQQAGGIVRPHISDMGKRMVIRSALAENKDRLKLFSRLAGEFGFCHKLAACISECKLYDISAEDLWEQAVRLEKEKGQQLLAAKLHDLSEIYRGLESRLFDRYTDPDDYMRLAAEKLPEAYISRGAKVWVDGFSGFTIPEYLVLERLFAVADAVKVALCMPAADAHKQLNETDIFFPTWKTFQKLIALAMENGVEIKETITLDTRRSRFVNPWLGHLEAEFTRWPGKTKAGRPRGIRLVSAANRRAEVEAVARQMIALARDKGYRWRDMSLMCRTLEPYLDLVRTVFKDYNIPVFIDQKQGVAHHPMVELLRSGLEIITTNWGYEAVFRCLKTDLMPLSRRDVDLLENYCLAYGIEGGQWTDATPWHYAADLDLENPAGEVASERYLEKVNELRSRVKSYFLPLEHFDRHGKYPVEAISDAVYKFLTGLNAREKLAGWRLQDEQEGNLTRAREHEQVWEQIMELLDQMVEIMGEEELTVKEYLNILEAGLEQLRVGLIPPGLDQALVGNIERSRTPPNIKALFLLGINDGIFPLQRSEEQIFGDEEREYLAAANLELAPTSKTQLMEEQYLIYISLTRASEYLWLSFPLADEEGKALNPSSVINRVQGLFPDLETEYIGLEPQDDHQAWEYIVPGWSSLGLLINKLREAKDGKELAPVWRELYQFYLQQDETSSLLLNLLDSLKFSVAEERLTAELIDEIYANPIKVSVSRLEQFASCPFSYFAEHVLKLKERRRLTLDAPNLGIIYHQALADFVLSLQREKLDWGSLNRDKQRELLNTVLAKISNRLENAGLLKTAQSGFLLQQVRENLYYAVDILKEHAERGKFVTRWVEAVFDHGGEMQPVEVPVEGGWKLLVRGRVDRIDLLKGKGKNYLRVIDYKSSQTRFQWWQVYYGLQLQLITYLWAALKSAPKLVGDRADIAGAFYFPVSRPLVSVNGPVSKEAIRRQLKKESRMKGILLADREVARLMGVDRVGHSDLLPVRINKDDSFSAGNSSLLSTGQLAQVLKFTENKLRELGKKIVSGNIDIKPYRHGKTSPCSRCRYKSVCWFDVSFEGCSYNFLDTIDDRAVLESIRQYGESGEG